LVPELKISLPIVSDLELNERPREYNSSTFLSLTEFVESCLTGAI